jgi:hypothetical protein
MSSEKTLQNELASGKRRLRRFKQIYFFLALSAKIVITLRQNIRIIFSKYFETVSKMLSKTVS